VLFMVAAAWAGDRDGDGLSDFDETHKYGTDPAKADSDGDGKPDGDWSERREYAYTVRSVVRVMRPAQAISGMQQDARIRKETGEWIELEVIHYPLNTATEALAGEPVDAKADPKWLASTTTSNFDDEMRRALTRDGDDATRARAAAARLLDRAKYHRGFTTFFVAFEDGKPKVAPGLEEAVENGRLPGVDLDEQWRRELFTKGMFETRAHGSCTSTAIYLAGGLRAAGVPARLVYCIPVIDPNDASEWAMLDGLQHHRVRTTIQHALARSRHMWASHTFNEVFVRGRWWWLNYKTLGQKNLDPNCFGLLTHVLTVRDWADARMWETVGQRQGTKTRDDAFGHGNPYSTIELSDEFGVHAEIENPPAPEFRSLTIGRAVWYDDPARPRNLKMHFREEDAGGHVLFQVKENRDGSLGQYAAFWEGVDRASSLKAGKQEVEARAARGYWGNGWFYLRIEPENLRAMKPGVEYELVPRNRRERYRWVAEGITLAR